MAYDKLFTPMNIGKCTIPNRLVVPAIVTNMCTEGVPNEQYIRYHEEKAKGGWGLIITEDYLVNPHAGANRYLCGLWSEEQVEANKKFTDIIHQYETKIFCQIYHAGRQSNMFVSGGAQPVSCSPVPCAWNKTIPHELTVEEIKEIVGQFGLAARNAKRAGFDGIEIHAAHGYLLHQFLSANCNHRVDEYGGSYDNRMRFLKEVYDICREEVGPDFPIIVRVSCEEHTEGGRKLQETRQILKDLERWGVDAINASTSMYGVNASVGTVSSHYAARGWLIDFAAEIKKFLKIPVMIVNRIAEPGMAEDTIEEGRADFIAIGRGSLADPHWPNKAKAGKPNDIRHCIGCLQACCYSSNFGVPMFCTVNPELGHEYEYDYSKAEVSKTVYIAGAGIAGLEAARAAAIKGHKVELFESKNSVGGQFVVASYPPYKAELIEYVAWLNREIKKYDNITLHLNTELTAQMVLDAKPDKVIIATGAKPYMPEAVGMDDPRVMFAEDAMLGKKATGMNVLIVGAADTACETAAFLAMQCKDKVTMLIRRDRVAPDMWVGQRGDVVNLLNRLNVETMVNTHFLGMCPEGAMVKQDEETKTIPCDTLVLAVGVRSNVKLAEELKVAGVEVSIVGDAVQPRLATQASIEGFVTGLNV